MDSVDLTVPRGSIFGLIGPNGSGKTTTMRLVLRIYQPDAGNVTVLGQSGGSTADDRVGYLPEERGLYRRMSVRNVLRYFAKLKNVSHADTVIDEWLERMGALDWKKKKIDQLSKGMAQKIQFIVAIIAKPELVILDEPFSGLDPVNLDLMRQTVVELRDSGTTVIFSTHDMGVAQEMCDHVCMIHQGRKVLDGTINSIRDSHGRCRLRVGMQESNPLPDKMVGVTSIDQDGEYSILQLEDESDRPGVLKQLTELGDIRHFETFRPSLHDIFVSIANPDSSKSDLSNERETADA